MKQELTFRPIFFACLAVNPPGQKLQRQLQVVLQCVKLLDVTAKTDVAKEEPRTELLSGEKT